MRVEIQTNEHDWCRMVYRIDDEWLEHTGNPLVLCHSTGIPTMCGGKFFKVGPAPVEPSAIKKILSKYANNTGGAYRISYSKYLKATQEDKETMLKLGNLHAKPMLHHRHSMSNHLSNHPGLFALHCANKHVPEVEEQLGWLFDEVCAKKLEGSLITKWVWGLTAEDVGHDEYDYDYDDGEWRPEDESRDYFLGRLDMLKPVVRGRAILSGFTCTPVYVEESFDRETFLGPKETTAQGVTVCNPKWFTGDIGRAFDSNGYATHYSRNRLIEDVKKMVNYVSEGVQFIHITCNYLWDYRTLAMSIERIGQWLWPGDIPGLSHVELTLAENPNEYMHDIVMVTLVFPEGVKHS